MATRQRQSCLQPQAPARVRRQGFVASVALSGAPISPSATLQGTGSPSTAHVSPEKQRGGWLPRGHSKEQRHAWSLACGHKSGPVLSLGGTSYHPHSPGTPICPPFPAPRAWMTHLPQKDAPPPWNGPGEMPPISQGTRGVVPSAPAEKHGDSAGIKVYCAGSLQLSTWRVTQRLGGPRQRDSEEDAPGPPQIRTAPSLRTREGCVWAEGWGQGPPCSRLSIRNPPPHPQAPPSVVSAHTAPHF